MQVDKTELQQIYYDILSADSLAHKYYLTDSIINFETKEISQSEMTYYIADYNMTKNGIWTEKVHDSLVIISEHRLHSKAKEDIFTKIPINYSFSLPYFSKDRQSFLIYYNNYFGNLCAEYSLRLYKKTNGKWVYIESYFSIIS